MDSLNLCGHGFGISMNRVINQMDAVLNPADRFNMSDLPDGQHLDFFNPFRNCPQIIFFRSSITEKG